MAIIGGNGDGVPAATPVPRTVAPRIVLDPAFVSGVPPISSNALDEVWQTGRDDGHTGQPTEDFENFLRAQAHLVTALRKANLEGEAEESKARLEAIAPSLAEQQEDCDRGRQTLFKVTEDRQANLSRYSRGLGVLYIAIAFLI